jgi:Alr-MurF fusion protein
VLIYSENIQTSAKYLLTDSRRLMAVSESIFFAIKGIHHDGHRFIRELYDRGLREFVVESPALSPVFVRELEQLTHAKVWIVENSIRAVQKLATEHRAKFDLPIVAVTGSNAKTIVKEWLSVLLGQRYQVVKSPKSFNSQLGVPLSVWQISPNHTMGVFEAGISRPNEMAFLEKIIRPQIGIFTNIGSAHSEFFEDNRQKIQEKLKLFAHARTLIYCADYTEVDDEIKHHFIHQNPDCKLISWARVGNASLRTDWQVFQQFTQIKLQSDGKTLNVRVPFTDEASIENVTHCLVLMWTLGFSEIEINARVQQIRQPSMRLELKEGVQNSLIIDDTYNNDIAGLTMALDFLNLQKQKNNKIVVLSDLLETGLTESELYGQIAVLLRGKKVNQLIGIGNVISRNQEVFPSNSVFYPSTEVFLEKHSAKNFQDSLVLVKGARKFSFERIVERFQLRTHGTTLEINLDAVYNNFHFYRTKVGPQTKIMAMVKALAYGSGSAEVATLLQYHGVDYLAVAYADEGVTLRENGIYVPIMVMNPQPEDFQKLLDFRLEPEIYSPRILQEFSEFIDGQNTLTKIHVKLDTGMHRLGFEEIHLENLISQLRSNPNLIVASIFSHLAAADEDDKDVFTRHQLNFFESMANRLSEGIGYSPDRHALNSAGIARFTEYKMDMVRLGVGLYGVAARSRDQFYLQTVGTLKTVISQIKHVPAGESIGYGRRGTAQHDTTIATIAIGYADGYDRRFSRGVGKVLVNGQLCPVIGNVCMDMTMIDITGVPAHEGDVVVVFGQNPSIMELAKWIETIPYEILTNVSSRVKRVFFKE